MMDESDRNDMRLNIWWHRLRGHRMVLFADYGQCVCGREWSNPFWAVRTT